MEIITWQGKRKLPTNVTEYFVALYCKRRKLKPHIGQSGGLSVWKSLSSAEKNFFKEKFEKWQDDNDEKMIRVLENAEPFLKKKPYINKENFESLISGTNTYYDENQSNLSKQTIDDVSNADLELSKQEHTDVESHTSETRDDNEYHNSQSEPMISHQENIDDNMYNVSPEVSNQYYAASVIDREQTVHQETRNKITEPIPPTNLKSKELFEIIKYNGTRPELASVEWKDLTRREKTLYRNATIRIKKEYLNKYEKYLQSLSDPELFNIYMNISEN